MSTEATETTRIPGVIQPPEDLNALLDLTMFLDNHAEPAVLLGPDGEQTPLPREVYAVLRRVVTAMQAGESISLQPIDRQLTTQQAADLLGVSRMTVVRLLDEHELPYERLGGSRHRRIRLNDLLSYRKRKSEDNENRLTEMTRQAVEDGLYDVDADTYQSALTKARKAS